MIKSKKIILTIAIFVLSILIIPNVDAATIHYKYGLPTNIKYANDAIYNDSYFEVYINGATYTGYCPDPGYHMYGSVTVSCQPLTNAAMSWLLQNLTGNHVVDQLAIRMLAIRENLNKSVQGNGTYIVKYLEERLSTGTSNQLYGSDEIDQAYQLHLQALANKGSASNDAATLTFTKTGGSGATVEYKMTSSTNISSSSIDFTCEGCTINSKNWNGTEGTIKVTANTGNCSFKINAFYPASGMYMCDGGVGMQDIIVPVTAVTEGTVSTDGEPTQTFTGTIDSSTGGSYYEKYCKSACDEKTEINIPTYCDDANEQSITITAPKNVKSCILKGKDDDGNTYQSVAVDNNYCSVYCAENYEMKLPGARYTTSGKYFKLENTVVKATRSCYATSPTRETSKTNIDIEQFIDDIIAKQKEIIAARDAYLKAVATKNVTATSESDTKCDGTSAEPHYEKAATNYTGVAVKNCDRTTGVCTVKDETHQTDKVEWGHYNTKNETTKSNCTPTTTDDCKECTDSESDVDEPDWDGAIATAKSNLKAKVTELEAIITDMQNCYSWVNDLCFDPEVVFDYNESYNTDINYEQISSSISNNSEVTYSQVKDIDNAYTTSGDATLEDRHYLYCDENGCYEGEKGKLAEQISTLSTHYYYVKKVSKGTAEYNNTQEFQTNYPHGTIDTVDNKDNLKYNYSYLGAVFPVALKTDTGVYNWTLKFTKIGQYNEESCKLGRLDEVAGKIIQDDIGYVCVYVVDCDDCDYECTCPENLPTGYSCVKKGKFVCDIYEPDPKCDECDVYCVNCIFDGNDTYTYRTISLTDINPNNRTMGSNWTGSKGETTQKEIEESNEQIYKESEYSYTITPTQMKKIRDYNNSKGTYVADDLDYHKQGDYNNVYGTSDFLDNGVKEGYFTQNKRNTKWTLWTGEINTDGSGPSWK